MVTLVQCCHRNSINACLPGCLSCLHSHRSSILETWTKTVCTCPVTELYLSHLQRPHRKPTKSLGWNPSFTPLKTRAMPFLARHRTNVIIFEWVIFVNGFMFCPGNQLYFLFSPKWPWPCVRSRKIPIRLIENRRIRLMSRMERFRIFWTHDSAYLPFSSFACAAHSKPFLIHNILLSLANNFLQEEKKTKKLKVSDIAYYLVRNPFSRMLA